MRNRPLGCTGLQVSEIALGTVELGMQYGFRGSAHYQPPDPQEAIRLLRSAFDSGITLIDTAPSYGTAEALIGRAFAGMANRPLITTKVIIPDDCDLDVVTASIETSLRTLQTDAIDLLQIHNTSVPILECQELLDGLEEMRRQGKIRHLGASVDYEETAWRALSKDRIETVQTPFNLLNQRMGRRVFCEAAERNRGVLIRSAYLRGVLTAELESIPARLTPLKTAAQGAWQVMAGQASTLSEAALRFCLSFPATSTVIVGMRSVAELESNTLAAGKGPLSPETLRELAQFAIEDERLINPVNWQDLI